MSETILLVDDEQQVIKALKRSLRGASYEIFSATSGNEALGILDTIKVDVVISDQRMPGMSGSEFLCVVARDFPDTVGILLTGNPSVDAIVDAVNEGQICRFIIKPWNDIELETAIQDALKHRRIMTCGRNGMSTQ